MGELRVISTGSVPFYDRKQAGKLLAGELMNYQGQDAVVLGIPRGGVIIAREVAHALDAELDIVLARKLRTPGYPELAMGSIGESGKIFLNTELIKEMGLSEDQIRREAQVQITEITRRTQIFREVRPKVELKGRLVIVTDDGVATGATTRAAFLAVRQEQPRRLVAAIPVGSADTVQSLAQDVDEMVCLRTPPGFAAVGQFYQRFYPVEDEDVLRILKESADKMAKP